MLTAPALSHVQTVWETFGYVLQPLAALFHLVWYDSRAAGLSDRSAIDFSMAAMVRDLEAVIESAGLTSFAAVALNDAVPIAVTYAATRSEELTSLILIDGWTKFSDYHQNPAFMAEEALCQGDWILYTEPWRATESGIRQPAACSRLRRLHPGMRRAGSLEGCLCQHGR